ncbi:MAG: membrane protein insertion efficiency factor YidD [Candidatus Gracilibacteria bacterium]
MQGFPKFSFWLPQLPSLFQKIYRFPVQLSVFCINIYQRTFSPDTGMIAKAFDRPPFCKHIPTCSEYTKEALLKRGFILGVILGCWRILRCNPWSRGGYDPVPVGKPKNHHCSKSSKKCQ